MKYLAVLGRQPEISLAELSALFPDAKQFSPSLATFSWTGDGHGRVPTELAGACAERMPWEGKCPAGPVQLIDRLGGTLKVAEKLDTVPLEYLHKLPDGKITIGISDYSKGASKKTAVLEGLKLKKILVRHGRSVRVVESKDAVLPTATSLHNGLSGRKERKVELIKVNDEWFKVIGVQDIDAYARRDQARPARDARVGMLPPKLAQILINLCGPLPENATILDPFCGTGVVLQEALLMGYHAYGTDLSERMVEYSKKNLEWLIKETEKRSFEGPSERASARVSAPSPWRPPLGTQTTSGRRATATRPEKNPFSVSLGDATSFQWQPPIDAVACEGYLGKPMSMIPPEIKLKTEQQECSTIVLGFLKNLSTQIKPGTPVVMAVPAWRRENGSYSRLDILDEIEKMGYNVNNKTREGLLYARTEQIVARDIIILRKN